MRLVQVGANVIRGDGQGRINLEITRAALRRGWHVTLVAADVDREVLDAGAEWERIAVPSRPVWPRIAAFVRLADGAVDRLRGSGRADRVIANGYTLTRPHDLNLCQFVHHAWGCHPASAAPDRPAWQRVYQRMFTNYNVTRERQSFDAAGIVIAPSRLTAGELIAAGVPSTKVRVIYNGVDPDEFHATPDDAKRARIAVGLPPDVPMALFTGDLRLSRKGPDTAIRAAASVPGLHLAMAGRSEGDRFVRLASNLGVSDRVHFLGFRRDVADLMRACDVFLFPTRYEACALVVLEALASGLAVVSTAAAGSTEVIVDPAAGRVIEDPEDVGAISDALREVIGRCRYERSAAARACALRHTWDLMAEAYLRLLSTADASPACSMARPDDGVEEANGPTRSHLATEIIPSVV